jgi:prophage regulatory protein
MQNITSFLRDTEIAIRYSISRPTVWRWVKQGKFPKPIKLGGGSTRWSTLDLQEWEKNQRPGDSGQ